MATFMGKSMMTPITPPNLMRPMFQTHQEPSRMLQGARTIHTTRPEATLQRCRQHLNRGGTGRGRTRSLTGSWWNLQTLEQIMNDFVHPITNYHHLFLEILEMGCITHPPKGGLLLGLPHWALSFWENHLVATCGWEDSTLTLLSLCGRIPCGLWKSWQWGLSDIAITHNMDAYMAYG
jgi:hypothetical protein